MSAWGVGVFENDAACDYASKIIAANDFSAIEAAFENVLSVGAEYLEAPLAQEALVSADVVVRLCGHSGEKSSYTAKIDDWIRKTKKKPDGALIHRAALSVQRILGSSSELLELWQESTEYEIWRSNVAALLKRLA
jgi:hypothetical protein